MARLTSSFQVRRLELSAGIKPGEWNKDTTKNLITSASTWEVTETTDSGAVYLMAHVRFDKRAFSFAPAKAVRLKMIAMLECNLNGDRREFTIYEVGCLPVVLTC